MQTNRRHLGLQGAMAQELTLLSDIQRSAKHPKNRPTGSRLNLSKLTLRILKQGMAIPTNRVGQTRLAVEIRKGTLGRTLMTLAHKDLVLGVLAHRQNTRLPGKGMATMKTRRMGILGGTLGLLQNLLHDFRRKTLRHTRRLFCLQNLGLLLRSSRRKRRLIRRDTQKENNGSLRSLGHYVVNRAIAESPTSKRIGIFTETDSTGYNGVPQRQVQEALAP